MSIRTLLSRLLLLLLTAAPALAAAGATLRVLAWPGYADPDLVRQFEKRHDARVEVTLVSTDDDMRERLRKHNGGDFDVFAANTAEISQYIEQGISVALDPAAISNTKHQLARFRDLSAIPGIVRNGAVYAIPYTYSEMGLIYDRAQFGAPPFSISALWDPRYRGRVLAFQDSTHNFSIAAQALGMKDPFQIAPGEFSRVARHLVGLRRNVLAFYTTPEEATELFIRHRAALMFANFGAQQVEQLRRAGADIGYVIPKEGALAWLDCWSLAHGVRDRKLAQAWIDFTLEEAFSRALTTRHGLANTREASLFMQPGANIVWLAKVEQPARRAALWRKIFSGDLPQEL
jgi:putative spermidine/putrescine transport system substrate-binding protein